MLLESLHLQNFRAFEHLDVSFVPGVNLLIGDNATGKTTILDAARVAIGSWFLGFSDVPATHISEYDVRRQFHRHHGEFSVEPQWPVVVGAKGQVDGRSLKWSRKRVSVNGRTNRIGAEHLKRTASIQGDALRRGEATTLPVIAYYPAGRLWLPAQTGDDSGPESRLEGYRDCLKASSDQQRVRTLWKKRELIGLQQGTPLPQMIAVRNAAIQAIPNAREVFYDLNQDDIVVEFESGETTPFSALSDGFRSTLAMITDIVSRATTLNPHLGKEAANLSPGVVLIDEIGLHLHPAWQRHMLGDLRSIFPKIQFIVTTHAPQVLVGAMPGELQILQKQNGQIALSRQDIPPGLHADQVLTGVWFGLMSTLEPGTLQALEQHRELLRIPQPTPEQSARRSRLESILRDRLGRFSDTSMERMALAIIADLTRKINPTTVENREKIRKMATQQLKARLDDKV